jgi:hypothetical protein
MVPRGLVTTGIASKTAIATAKQRRPPTKQGKVQAPLGVANKEHVPARTNTSCLHAVHVGVGIVDDAAPPNGRENINSSRNLFVSSSKCLASKIGIGLK